MPDRMILRAASLALVAAAAGTTGCAPAPKPVPPVVFVTPQPTPTPTAPPVIERDYANWLDAPQTPGDWSYDREASESLAEFVAPGNRVEFILRCDLRSRQVSLGRPGVAEGPVPLRIRTETAERLLSAAPPSGGVQMLTSELAASDPLLDAMAFSRGRFAVETAGLRTLYLPAWPEVTRVIEDCR